MSIDKYSGSVLFVIVTLAAVLAFSAFSSAQVSLTQLSEDTFTNNTSQHATEVEPSAFTWGSTIVTAFQVARIFGGGGADIGFATSTDGGAHWTNGYLPGITMFQGNGTYQAASDASVAYDALHGVWLISTLPIGNNTAVAVSRSTDGINWSNPTFVPQSGGADKNWIVCDNTASSPFYGHCYQEWDNSELQMSTSTDGGVTWGPARATQGQDFGIGGLPLVQPSGKVVVPFLSFSGSGSVMAFSSTDGGNTWTRAVKIVSFINHGEAGDDGGLRSAGLPSAAIDKAGRVWVAWPDCRFRSGCSSNDIVYSTSAKGTTWTAVKRIPIDAVTSTVDHFITGMAIEPGTSGSKTHVGLVYYFYPISNCQDCKLSVGFIQSSSKGKAWSPAQILGGPMDLSWLPNTFSGRMVADYIAVGFGGGKAYPIFALAQAPTGSLFHQAIYTTATGLAAAEPELEQLSAIDDRPIANAHSDHVIKAFVDNEVPAQSGQPPDSD